MSTASDVHWKQRPEGGGLFAIWLIRTFALHAGRLPSRLVLLPITLYFLLVRGPERRASRAFLSRVFGRPATLWEVARHIHTFASTILDRVFLLSEQFRRYDLRVHGLDALHAELDKGRGVLLFGAHVGSFEALRVLSLKRPDISVRVVLDKGQSPALTQLLDALNPNIAGTVIDAAGGTVRQVATLAAGISSDKARELNKFIKALGLKGIQSQTQGDAVRVIAKKRDDLQAVIAACKEHDFGIPIQTGNFRD